MPVVTNQTEVVEFLEKARERKGISHNGLMLEAGHTTRQILKLMTGTMKQMRLKEMFELGAILGVQFTIDWKPTAKARRIAAAKASRPDAVTMTYADEDSGDPVELQVPRELFDRIREELDGQLPVKPQVRRLASVA